MMTMRSVIVVGWACGLMALGGSVAAQEAMRVTSSEALADVAVVPFANLTSTPSDDWLGFGFASALVVDLGVALSSADVTGDARWVIRGSYQQVETHLRVTAGVVDTESGRLLDAVTLDGDRSELFALQDELSVQLAEVLARGGVSRPLSVSAPGDASEGRPVGQDQSQDSSKVPPVAPLPIDIPDDLPVDIVVRAIQLDAPLEFDGRLDESVYRDVPPVSGFTQQEPAEGELATDQTEVWVLFDDDTFYVSLRCWSEDPERIIANEIKRDGRGIFGNETIAVLIDTFLDRRNGYEFKTNLLGGIFDATVANEQTSNRDWNGVWNVRASRFEEGWSVEMAIPFKTLRYRPGGTQRWGLNVQRRVAAKNEISFLAPIPRALSYMGMYKFSSAATIVDLKVPDSGRRFEIKPYGIADATTQFSGAGGSTALGADGGVDVKVGVTEGLTADFTYNTDFAQVEVDEQQVNLTRFGLFFPEKREFFLEGQGLFDFGPGRNSGPMASAYHFKGERYGTVTPVLFFSRRIGLSGGRTVPIEVGGRLTGKAGPYSVGLLNVQTGTESGTGAVPTNFSVVRLKRDVLRRSTVGTLFTGRSVSIAQEGGNRVYGVDGDFGFYDNLRVNAYLARSESPEYKSDDLSYQAKIDYSGDRWGVTLDHLAVGKHFNPEVGFVRRADFRRNFGSFRWTPRPASQEHVRRFLLEGSLDYTRDGAGALATRIQQALFATEFQNGDRIFAGATDNYEYLNQPFQIAPDVDIPVGAYSFLNKRVVYVLASQRLISGGISVDRGDFFGGERTSLGYSSGRVALSSNLSVEPSMSFNWISLPQGELLMQLVAVRSTYTLTPRMFSAALVQFNSSNNALSTNIRFRWEYQPGSELFVVYTDERDTLLRGFPSLENRAIVVKVTRLFRF